MIARVAPKHMDWSTPKRASSELLKGTADLSDVQHFCHEATCNMSIYKVSWVSHRPLKVQDLTVAAAEAAANIYQAGTWYRVLEGPDRCGTMDIISSFVFEMILTAKTHLNTAEMLQGRATLMSLHDPYR